MSLRMCGACERFRLRLAASGAGLLLGVGVAAGAAATPAPLSFQGAQLGMTLDAWRALAPPQGGDAAPACSDDARIRRAAGNPLGVSDPTPGMVSCGYVNPSGDYVLTRPVPLDAAYNATNVRYLFARGRLAEIRFETSIDAYSDVTAMLDRQYGPRTRMTRDWTRSSLGRSPRVRLTWILGGGTIELVDPSNRLTTLEVTLTGGPDASASQSIAGGSRSNPG